MRAFAPSEKPKVKGWSLLAAALTAGRVSVVSPDVPGAVVRTVNAVGIVAEAVDTVIVAAHALVVVNGGSCCLWSA